MLIYEDRMAYGDTLIVQTGLYGDVTELEDNKIHEKLSVIFANDRQKREEHKRRVLEAGIECIEVQY